MKIGVNFDGFKISQYQNRSKPPPPQNYIQDSFKIFLEHGCDLVRIPVYWESYEKDPEGFISELSLISDEADKNNISCIYDNHQWECSSFLGYGIGFPNSIVSPLFQNSSSNHDAYKQPSKEYIEKFWNNWWDRKIRSFNGADGWDLQLEFLHKVIETVNNKTSTVAFELLNEPQVFRHSDFKKISKYHDYLLSKVIDITDKAMIFCYSYAGRRAALNFPWVQAKIKPSLNVSNKIIFDVHPYPPYFIVMSYFKLILKLMKTNTILVGEYNSGTRDGVNISLSQHKRYLETMNKFFPYGVMFWQWSYIIDSGHSAFNLARIVDGKISLNANFDSFVKAIKDVLN
ncbi:MAG TPA: cellulase family glycosylhydrolase [Candidatus Nitrosocosmicus sp.]|nr:cellulase family glycosylhydrolase [Candidatus Nitrosocosmicus sp.]